MPSCASGPRASSAACDPEVQERPGASWVAANSYPVTGIYREDLPSGMGACMKRRNSQLRSLSRLAPAPGALLDRHDPPTGLDRCRHLAADTGPSPADRLSRAETHQRIAPWDIPDLQHAQIQVEGAVEVGVGHPLRGVRYGSPSLGRSGQLRMEAPALAQCRQHRPLLLESPPSGKTGWKLIACRSPARRTPRARPARSACRRAGPCWPRTGCSGCRG